VSLNTRFGNLKDFRQFKIIRMYVYCRSHGTSTLSESLFNDVGQTVEKAKIEAKSINFFT
jgi:hypothetical protein